MLHYMVSSGTGQLPTKPSQGVLYLLERSGLMASSRYVYATSLENKVDNGGFFLKWIASTDNFLWFPVPASLAARTVMGTFVAISSHG